MKKTILTDVDGVLLNWEYAFEVWMLEQGFKPNTPSGQPGVHHYKQEEKYGISKEQAKRYKEYQNGGDYPDWVDEIDWDEGEKTNRAGNDSVISVKVIEECLTT